MLNYFRINDLSRLLAIAIILVIIRLPFYIWGDVIGLEDIRYLLLGEKISGGDWLYVNIYTSEALFSGLLVGFIVLLFGKSIVALHIIAYFLTVIQVYLFNNLVTENRATISQTYYPGLFYALFISLFPGSFTLSPFLLAQTFLLVAINYQFNHLELKVKRDEKIILIGILISICSLMAGSAAIFIVPAYLVLALYTNTMYRRYILIGIGFVLPYLIIWGIFEISGHSGIFFSSLPDQFDGKWLIKSEFLYLSILPLFFLISFLGQSIFGGRFTNYQSTLNFAIFIWAIIAVVVFWMGRESGNRSFLLLVPIMALYASHYFLARRTFKRSLYFGFILIVILYTNFAFSNRPSYLQKWISAEPSVDSQYADKFSGQKVWVLEDGFEKYPIDALHGTAFFDYEMYQDIFYSPVDFFRISDVSRGFKGDFPDVILDKEGLLTNYFPHIPALDSLYTRNGDFWERSSN